MVVPAITSNKCSLAKVNGCMKSSVGFHKDIRFNPHDLFGKHEISYFSLSARYGVLFTPHPEYITVTGKGL